MPRVRGRVAAGAGSKEELAAAVSDDHVEPQSQSSQHGQQLSGAELRAAAAFEARQRLSGDARPLCHSRLQQPQGTSTHSDRFTQTGQ